MARGSDELKPILGSVVDESFMLDVMTRQGVEVVFHAAAYKHVRMVQENVAAGVENNVFGTYAAARAAISAGHQNVHPDIDRQGGAADERHGRHEAHRVK